MPDPRPSLRFFFPSARFPPPEPCSTTGVAQSTSHLRPTAASLHVWVLFVPAPTVRSILQAIENAAIVVRTPSTPAPSTTSLHSAPVRTLVLVHAARQNSPFPSAEHDASGGRLRPPQSRHLGRESRTKSSHFTSHARSTLP